MTVQLESPLMFGEASVCSCFYIMSRWTFDHFRHSCKQPQEIWDYSQSDHHKQPHEHKLSPTAVYTNGDGIKEELILLRCALTCGTDVCFHFRTKLTWNKSDGSLSIKETRARQTGIRPQSNFQVDFIVNIGTADRRDLWPWSSRSLFSRSATGRERGGIN